MSALAEFATFTRDGTDWNCWPTLNWNQWRVLTGIIGSFHRKMQLVRQGALASAESELGKAENLSPGLDFARPDAVQELRAKIAAQRASTQQMSSAGNGSFASQDADAVRPFPWSLLFLGIGAVGVIVLVVRSMKPKASPLAYVYPPSGGAATNANSAPGYGGYGVGGTAPIAGASGGVGSHIVSGLATGAAMGAGVVAGEALAHHFMDGGHGDTSATSAMPAAAPTVPTAPTQPAYDMGGSDFGVSDNSSWSDSQNASDTGGSNDWG